MPTPSPHNSRNVLITGATGYMGSRLAQRLIDRGHRITAIAREASKGKLPAGCKVIVADVLNADTWKSHARRDQTIVHLVGTPHPSPSKARQFVEIDLRSLQEAVAAAVFSGVEHFVYVSVAHPAPAMKAYIEVRTQCESIIRASGLRATILRPWYVLGPGHRWPITLIPFYRIAERIPATAEAARRLGLVTIRDMLAALVHSVEHPTNGLEILEVPAIRKCGSSNES
ncbi:MAG TPA: NAD(P)-dependent oxidoreductase [Bryobacteraceae bacterium]|nr:NAD(P)-dependent oxidoreductase [Bryobacteraceae bacterium]